MDLKVNIQDKAHYLNRKNNYRLQLLIKTIQQSIYKNTKREKNFYKNN
jgi:hypothetical protein